MANIIVKDINYVTTGTNEKFVSLDIGYSPDAFNVTFLAPEEDLFDEEQLTFLGEGDTAVQIAKSYKDHYLAEYLKYSYIPNMVYAASIEKNYDEFADSKVQKNNLYSIFQNDGGKIIHNLYDIRDLAIKSNIEVGNPEYSELYCPIMENQPIGIVQHGNYTYCMTDMCGETVNFGKTNILENRPEKPTSLKDCIYKNKIASESIDTYMYNPISLSSSNMQDNYTPAKNLKNLSCNYILELQNNDKYNDFEEGDIYGDAFSGKYAYDATYSMRYLGDDDYKSKVNALSIGDETFGMPKFALADCRQYVGIGKCGDTVFLKYYDNIWYNKQKDADLSTDVNANVVPEKENERYTKYQKIETIQSINRFEPATQHRTNLFSIKINDTGINKLDDNPKLNDFKQMMMSDIQSNIKMLVSKISPAHTQLFNIEIN